MDLWRTDLVRKVDGLFLKAPNFNQPIGNWNTARMHDLSFMFSAAIKFNQPIGRWNTGSILNLDHMFANATTFNQDVGSWKTESAKRMEAVFGHALSFNQVVGRWDVRNVHHMEGMFFQTHRFDQSLLDWNTGRVTILIGMFFDTESFNQPIGKWNTGSFTDLRAMFNYAKAFNQPLGRWNTERVTEMSQLFSFANEFNRPLVDWNTKHVSDMKDAFEECKTFDQPIRGWNTARVSNVNGMFSVTNRFNQAVGGWNMGSVIDLGDVFYKAKAFNQPIGTWNTNKVTSLDQTFFCATSFRQGIFEWNVSHVESMRSLIWKSPAQLCEPCWPSNVHLILCIWLVLVLISMFRSLKDYTSLQVFPEVSLDFKFRRLRRRLTYQVSWSKVNLACEDPLAVGREVHSRVTPQKWCITKKDLNIFEQEVRRALENGSIPNGTGNHHNPLHDDPDVGPTMYQVNQFFIKPLTAEYGGMSFALLLHPEGLDCDCFATHAWAEGVFEFCDKLRRGWPKQCYAMYVCFLANPQNLDISDLLDVAIEHSPFAKALSKASHMLVIPNRFVSIYTRLWCCFEAYFAYKLKKVILLPPAKLSVPWLKKRYLLCSFILVCTFLVSSKLIHIAFLSRLRRMWEKSRENSDWLQNIPQDIDTYHDVHDLKARLDTSIQQLRHTCRYFVIVLISLDLPLVGLLFRAVTCPSPPSKFNTCLNVVTSVVASLHLRISYEVRGDFEVRELKVTSDGKLYTRARIYDPTNLVYLYSSSVGVALCVSLVVHVLRVRTHEAKCEEAQQLHFNQLWDADCSDEADRRRITGALRYEVLEVEDALTTLMECGMSTPELRELEKLNGSAGYSDFGLIAFNLMIWPLFILYLCLFGTGMAVTSSYFHRTHVLCVFTWTVLYYVVCWVSFNAEPDLSNVVLRAGRLAWILTLICGLGFGMWGICAGVVCGVCFVAIHRKGVQHVGFQQFMDALLPVGALCCACLCWELASTVAFGATCVCVAHEIVAISVSWLLWFVGLYIFKTRWSREKTLAVCGCMFVSWSAANCCLVAANMLSLTKFKFFLANAQQVHHEHLDLQLHYQWSASLLIAFGVLSPLVLVHREVSRAAEARCTQTLRESAMIELPVMRDRMRRDLTSYEKSRAPGSDSSLYKW